MTRIPKQRPIHDDERAMLNALGGIVTMIRDEQNRAFVTGLAARAMQDTAWVAPKEMAGLRSLVKNYARYCSPSVVALAHKRQ